MSKSHNTRDERLEIRLTATEHKMIRDAAELAGVGASTFLRIKGLESACRRAPTYEDLTKTALWAAAMAEAESIIKPRVVHVADAKSDRKGSR